MLESECIAGNHHLLEKIFSFCTTSTLLTSRLVCKLWGEETTRILRRRGIAIAFRAVEDIEDYLLIRRPLSHSLSRFVIDIPSAGGSVDPSSLDVVEEVPAPIVDLLECCRKEITSLKFWYRPQLQPGPLSLELEDDEDEVVPEVESCDTETCVISLDNLESLQLLSNYVQPTSPDHRHQRAHRMPQLFSHLQTPHLTHLAVQHLHDTECSEIVQNIIASSKHELIFFKSPAKLFPLIATSANFTHLRELDLLGIFHGFSVATNDTLDCIGRACPNLSKLGIEFSFRATLERIQRLLEILSKTLVELRCTIQDRNLLARQILRVDFTFPEMLRLKVLQMRWANPGFVYHLEGPRLPLLREIQLDTVWTRKIQGSLYPGGLEFGEGRPRYEQVATLKVTQVLSKEQVEVFANYFPNLTQFGASFEGDEALRAVYDKMKGLRWLIVERKSNITEGGGMCGYREVAEGNLEESRLSYVGNLKDLEVLELCQLGITSTSLLHGIGDLDKLKKLVIQAKAFRPLFDKRQFLCDATEEGTTAVECSPKLADSVEEMITSKLAPRLRHLTLWIRHTSEKPTGEDVTALERLMPDLDELTVVNHSLTGI